MASVYCLGGLLGSLASGYLSRRLGKSPSHILSCSVGITASLCLGLSKMAGSHEMILVGRFLCGIAVGLGINIYMQYLGESAPRKLRGVTNTTVALFVTIGKLFAQVVGLREVLGTEALWPLMLSLCGLTDLLQLIVMRFYPETPLHLLLVKGDQERCMKAMNRFWGHGDHQLELDFIRTEQEMLKNSKHLSVIELVKERSMRWQLIVAVVIIVTIQFSGINAILFYARNVFVTAGLPLEKIPYISMGMGSFETLAVMLCGVLIDHFRRKVMLLGSYGLMATMLALLTVSLFYQGLTNWMPYCSAVFIFLFIFFFGIGPGTLTVVIIMEVCSHSTRPAVLVIISSLNWAGLYIVGMGFPYIEGALGYYSFLIFLFSIVASGIFLFYFLPETKGKSYEQITLEFNRLNFKGKQPPKPKELSTSL
ncbi:solute carrier family 2, facilitated glucose transporter member 9-like isoform X2 [Hyperolius riggenbachi]